MPALTDRDKRTLRLAAAGVTIYLFLFFGWRGWQALESKRDDYRQLVMSAERLKQELQPYEVKTLRLEKLKGTYHLDPDKLSKATLVAEASAAIQRAATSGGVQLGPVRESPARPSAKELASMQIEVMGPVPAMMSLLHKLQTLGFPLIVESVQISADPNKPGAAKLNLTIVILDYEQWKKEETRHA
jgi:hypothetical protein